MFVAISDEAGDTGVSYRGGTRSFVSAIAIVRDENDLKELNDIARRFSRPYLKSQLRKWSDLKGSVKRNPSLLHQFYANTIDNFFEKTRFLIFSFFFLDKKKIETGTNPGLDKSVLERYIWQGYELCFKRIFAFTKRCHYVLRRYPTAPSLKWYLDRNISREKQIRDSILKLARTNQVKLSGPHFISKKEHDPLRKELATSVKIVDLFAGVTRVCCEYYFNNGDDCSERDCNEADCCSNPYISIWRLFLKRLCATKIRYRNKVIWDWNGVIYHPLQNRSQHERFLGIDPFII
ncbi:MAG: hypothetical protein LWW94_00645 [Candidatus Desulfofervidaceae bacterium]|nr:hypothetical protein [Candidatus Desulfofervidaceae bacterium]